jgi:hypothetical protein
MSRLLAHLRVLVVGLIGLLLAAGSGPIRAQSPDATLTKVGRVDHPPVDEMSGIVKSRRYENVWWVHNDSGDRPRLFAIDSTGGVHLAPWRDERFAAGRAATDSTGRPPWPGLALGNAAHIDYEDIALSDSTLYVGDIGNNGNARRDLGIYVVPEPYFYARRTRPMTHLRVRYPEQTTFPAQQWHYDAEGLFVDDGTLHVLTKRRKGQQIGQLEPGTTLYRLGTEHPHRVNTLTLVDRHDSIAPPTAAALSPSGDRLAVLCTTGVWIFPRPADGTHWLSTEPRRIPLSEARLRQAEAVTWDDAQTLRITNENRDVFVLPLAERPAERPAAAKD